ncbi:MAG: hypothetical protein WCS94_16545 [Verrucomicrobiota bacterium]
MAFSWRKIRGTSSVSPRARHSPPKRWLTKAVALNSARNSNSTRSKILIWNTFGNTLKNLAETDGASPTIQRAIRLAKLRTTFSKANQILTSPDEASAEPK